MLTATESLRARLAYEPRELKFGTSGRRGKVEDLAQLEVYINAVAEIEFLALLPRAGGGIAKGDEFCFAYDLRPSSTRYVPEQGGRGEIAQAIVRAIRDAGMQPVNLGRIPTPALAVHALARGKGSMMITGSHIPFDRNGYKVNTSIGELLKQHEGPVNERVGEVRRRIYAQPFAESPFDERGLFKTGPQELPAETGAAAREYVERYTGFFSGEPLAGKRILVYEHSAVGRDLLAEVLGRLGAEVVRAGRSDTFVPIDTENIDEAQLATIQALVDGAARQHGPIVAVASTDGDSDRPLLLGVDAASGKVRFYGGDLVGMIVAEWLRPDAVVVSISTNDAIDRGPLAGVLEPKTRIGSPYIIAGMEMAKAWGKTAVCGWEANGGFLTGTDFVRGGRVLKTLPTRDAMLPIVSVLQAAQEAACPLAELFGRLPSRFSRAALLRQFPRAVGLEMVRQFSPVDSSVREAVFGDPCRIVLEEGAAGLSATEGRRQQAAEIRSRLERFFPPEAGFGSIVRLNWTDGVRITFANAEIAHIRPSGNADELRVYAVAGSQERADAIAKAAIAEPDGILRRLERAVTRS